MDGGRGGNITDFGAYFYEVYECADGRYVSVAAIEAKFHAELLRLLEIDPETMPPQMDRERWPQAKARLAERFRTRTRDEWCKLLEGSDACFAPVLSMDEAPNHPHNRARGAFVDIGWCGAACAGTALQSNGISAADTAASGGRGRSAGSVGGLGCKRG